MNRREFMAVGVVGGAVASCSPAKACPARPAAIDCLGGTLGYIPGMIAEEQDIGYYANRCSYFDRQDINAVDGAVHFIGDSLIDGLDIAPACSYGLNRGIGGDTWRGLLNRINRGGSANSIHRAGAVVLKIGVNDVCFETAANAVSNVNFMIDQLAPAMTGKWVICHIDNVSSGNIGARNGLTDNNTRIDLINAYIDTKFGSNPNFAIVNVNPTLAPSGSLLSQYTFDGVHLSKAGCDVWRPVVAAALATFGIA